jgi:hypothetical protein
MAGTGFMLEAGFVADPLPPLQPPNSQMPVSAHANSAHWIRFMAVSLDNLRNVSLLRENEKHSTYLPLLHKHINARHVS